LIKAAPPASRLIERERPGPYANVFLQVAGRGFAAIHVAGGVHRDEFSAVAADEQRVAWLVQHEFIHPAKLGVADADAHFPAGILLDVRFGIGYIDSVVLVEEDSARPPELCPLTDEIAVLIENLQAIV